MEFISPTHGKLSFERMFKHIVDYMHEEPGQSYNVIIGTDSLLGDDTCFVTAVIIHRVGHGGRYFYHKFRNRKIESLRQRILYETSLSLETASQVSAQLAKNGFSELAVEIHLDVGDRGETKRIIREVVGMVQGSGYAAITKPDSYGASKVADRETGKLRLADRARVAAAGGSGGAGGTHPVGGSGVADGAQGAGGSKTGAGSASAGASSGAAGPKPGSGSKGGP